MQNDTKARKNSQENIHPDFFLKAIEDGGTFSADYRRLHGQKDTLPGQQVKRTWQQDLASIVSPTPTTGGELVATRLREYTDEWLTTGIDPDGKEAPYTRKLTGRAAKAVRWYEATRFSFAIDWDNGLEPRPRKIMQELTSSAYQKMPADVRAAAEIRAKGIFHALMVAPWRYQLAKCKRCYRYFTLDIKPSKTPYLRGMHCRGCKSVASAEASAKVKRAQREEQLLGLAAEVWPAWKPAPQFGERNEWVAGRVSKLLGEKKAIQRNWVTRHEADIIAKVKEVAHAKAG